MDVEKVKAEVQRLLTEGDSSIKKRAPSVHKQLVAMGGKKVRPVYFALGFICLTVVVFMFVLGHSAQSAVVNLIGFVWPMYQSLKAIKTEGSKDDTLWLTYWVVYGFFSVVESISDILLFWVPLYYPLKAGFLVWLYNPKTKGAYLLYNKLLSPAMDKWSPAIDKKLNEKMDQTRGKKTRVLQELLEQDQPSMAGQAASVTRKIVENELQGANKVD
jgi:receptor expression-enhancing protein 5/6